MRVQDFKMGETYTDKVTGFTGKATGWFQQLTGPDQTRLEGIDSTGRPVSHWVDVIRLEDKE